MAQLAIIGHNIRGNEVIKVLEMLGGENIYHKSCSNDSMFCYISDENRICELPISESYRDFVLFTLEEFIEKHPYEVEDEVLIKEKNKKAIVDKVVWCRDTVTYWLKYDGFIEGNWTAEHLQPYKQEIMKERKYANLRLDVDQDDKLATEITIDGDKITPPENYLIGKITKVDNGMLIEFVKKQLQYPKTYEECCKVLGSDPSRIIVLSNRKDIIHEENKHCYEMYSLYQLLICRDAYWRVAGENMGLGKTWEPDLESEELYCVQNYNKQIIKSRANTAFNRILVFPTEEIRDVFYDNFKELIESCKELL